MAAFALALSLISIALWGLALRGDGRRTLLAWLESGLTPRRVRRRDQMELDRILSRLVSEETALRATRDSE